MTTEALDAPLALKTLTRSTQALASAFTRRENPPALP